MTNENKEKKVNPCDKFADLVIIIISIVFGYFYLKNPETYNRIFVGCIIIILNLYLVIKLFIRLINPDKRKDQKGYIVQSFKKNWKILIAWVLTMSYIALTFIPSPNIRNNWVGLRPTETSTILVTSCPSQEVTSCPSCEPTKCPIIKETNCAPCVCDPCTTETPIPVESTVTQSLTPSWDFKDGCIPKAWAYWPHESWKHVVKEDLSCGGLDLGYFGFTAKENLGLEIIFPDADSGYVFGISRDVQVNLVYVEIRIKLRNFNSFSSIPQVFKIGFIDTEDRESLDGYYFYINDPDVAHLPQILRYDFQNPETPKFLGYLDTQEKNEFEILIKCDFLAQQKFECKYFVDGDQLGYIVSEYLPIEWDSIYLGYDIPKGGTVDLLISDFIVTTGN